MEQTSDKYFDLKGLSKYSSMGVSTLRDYLKDAAAPMPHFKVKGKILVKQSEFDAWIESNFRVDGSELETIVDGIMDSLKIGINRTGSPAVIRRKRLK